MAFKTDCFAFGTNKHCTILVSTECDKCKFYKTKAQFAFDANKSLTINERLKKCEDCKYRLTMSKTFDMHFDYRDCPLEKCIEERK